MAPGEAPRVGILLSDGSFVPLDRDTLSSLEFEAARRDMSLEDVFIAEEAAARELRSITPTNAELLQLADRFPAPQEWYDE